MAKKDKDEIPEEPVLELPESTADAYAVLSRYDQPREVEIPEETSLRAQTLEERMADDGDLTDMQAILLQLFPKGIDPKAAAVMVSRMHPDVFLPWMDIMSSNEFMSCDPTKPIDVAAIHMKWYVLGSIALDGKGRIDALELGGATRESKMIEKQLGNM